VLLLLGTWIAWIGFGPALLGPYRAAVVLATLRDRGWLAAAAIPAGVINVVPAGREVGAYLVSHPGVDKVAFTGSTAAGRHIAEACGRLLRPVTLELGGKSAAIVLEDANLDTAVIRDAFFNATMVVNGQACYASTRVRAVQQPAFDFPGGARQERGEQRVVVGLRAGESEQRLLAAFRLVSSWAMTCLLSTSANTVGSTYQPRDRCAGRPPPATSREPAAFPLAI
jgi:hypothetical protein